MARERAAKVGQQFGLVRSKEKKERRKDASLKEAVIYGDDGEESIDFVRL